MRYVEDVAGVGRASYGWLARRKFCPQDNDRETDYLDVLPFPRLLSLRVRIRRSSLGGGTSRVGCEEFPLRPDLRLDL